MMLRPPFVQHKPHQIQFFRPPFMAGLPGNAHQTLAAAARILAQGGDWFAGIGSPRSPGTAIFALTGKVNNTGLVEVEAIDTSVPLPARTQVASKPPVNENAVMYLQVGAFSQRDNADRMRSRLQTANVGTIQVVEGRSDSGPLYRVRVGPLASVNEADRIANTLVSQGISDTRVIVDERPDAERRVDGDRRHVRVREVAALPPEGSLTLPLSDGWQFTRGSADDDSWISYRLSRE